MVQKAPKFSTKVQVVLSATLARPRLMSHRIGLDRAITPFHLKAVPLSIQGTSRTIPNPCLAFQDFTEGLDATVRIESEMWQLSSRLLRPINGLLEDSFVRRFPARHRQVKVHSHRTIESESASGSDEDKKLLEHCLA
jgi:hypothetical protein